MNLYGFAGGDPVNYSDPFGLWPDCTPWPQCSLQAAINNGGWKGNIAAVADMFDDLALVNQAADFGVALREGRSKEAASLGIGLALSLDGYRGLGGLSAGEARAIQSFADRNGVEVTVTGSRARGTQHSGSDFDYIIGGNARIRHAARRELPRGSAGGEVNASGRETGIDIFRPDERQPSPGDITFRPSPPRP